MKQRLACHSGKPYVQSHRSLSILWHTLLAIVSRQTLFHLTSLPFYWMSLMSGRLKKCLWCMQWFVHNTTALFNKIQSAECGYRDKYLLSNKEMALPNFKPIKFSQVNIEIFACKFQIIFTIFTIDIMINFRLVPSALLYERFRKDLLYCVYVLEPFFLFTYFTLHSPTWGKFSKDRLPSSPLLPFSCPL